jgi:hypothetical protein
MKRMYAVEPPSEAVVRIAQAIVEHRGRPDQMPDGVVLTPDLSEAVDEVLEHLDAFERAELAGEVGDDTGEGHVVLERILARRISQAQRLKRR